MSLLLVVSIELLFFAMIAFEIKNEQKLIDFENKTIKRIRRKIRHRLYSDKIRTTSCEPNIPQKLKKSA